MKPNKTENLSSPHILTSGAHHVSVEDVNDHALKVIRRLHEAHFEAYLVGGSVRDLLLGKNPKDFDVATNALPEQANELFRNSRLIGRRFRLLHVLFGREIIEVATFRGHHSDDLQEKNNDGLVRNGMIVRDNVYGTLREDAWRRDFTVNALYFNPHDNTVVDFTGGFDDIKNHTLRIIGDAEQRYMEDPVRMLRAVRFAAKLGFQLHSETEAPIHELASRLPAVPAARLFDEVLKLFLGGHARDTFKLLRKYGLFEPLFPYTNPHLDSDGVFANMVDIALRNTDARIAIGKPVTPGFLFAVMLWQPVQEYSNQLQRKDMRAIPAGQVAGSEIIAKQATHVSLPRRFAIQAKEIWALQPRLLNRNGRRAFRLLEHPRFRAAYDFMLLRAEAGETDIQPVCDWWTEFQEQPEAVQASMVKKLKPRKKRRRRSSKTSDSNAQY